MGTTGLSLIDVFKTVGMHRRLITSVTIIAAIGGALFYLIGPKKYEAKTEFILRNPMYGDHTVIYNSDSRLYDYFANEDDVNRIILMSGSDLVQNKVIRSMGLATAYDLDSTNPKKEQELSKKFNKNLTVTRTEFRDLLLTYEDTNPERAAAVANECVRVLESSYSDYYKDMRKGMYESILDKLHDEDSTISALTDTLSILRDQYGIYDIISPGRGTIMLDYMKSNGNKNFGRGIELIQNVESIKDEFVGDRARQTGLINQYKTGIKNNQLPMIKVVTPAKIPVTPKGLGGILTVLACAFLGFFCSTIIKLISDNYFVKKAK